MLDKPNMTHRVVTIEKDGKKMAEARKNWAEAGAEVERLIHPLEGDLLEILATSKDLPETVDFLFLDGMFNFLFRT
jgi:predicted O-methyltransferase YrrM